jgi:two-component system CheB/CheR fusion protein
VDAEEFTRLFNTILINVTRFFRDPAHWEYLRDEILPGLVGGPDAAPIRVWSAGCASGEEAYSIAILLAEAMGSDAFRELVKIYATDVDEEALAQARPARRRRRSGSAAGALLRPAGRPVRHQQGASARGHLRPARPDPGCPDLAGGSPDLP